ncbi:hypothetical protein AKJ52_02895 [candidate division MSBL1 archaeon SCGC-AAA382C18]|uniref:Uncharacterized protein n=1 Tax=candidate division MSBL1 archaeon SCGC-AAA382C18 TaxID=1698281 RepID=A0A133VHH1_9EURY|nr:hypothetical protein AKJ52_02895 [candidate division MSBL1 archaeon SCGC-AAA382C18]
MWHDFRLSSGLRDRRGTRKTGKIQKIFNEWILGNKENLFRGFMKKDEVRSQVEKIQTLILFLLWGFEQMLVFLHNNWAKSCTKTKASAQ